jgi:hypothetical protein
MLTAPSPVSSTIPTPSPTPSWSAEGLAAIKAVQTSLETWDRLANNLTTADLNEIQLVELPPQSNNSLNQLAHWRSQGYSYQGWTEFTPTRVEYLGPDPWPGGDSWRVYGCYNISNAWVYNPDGSIHATGRIEESLSRFEVAAFTDNNGKQQWQVYDNSINEGSC